MGFSTLQMHTVIILIQTPKYKTSAHKIKGVKKSRKKNMKMETFEHFLTVGKSNNFVRGKICHVKITNLSLNEHKGCRKISLQTKALQYESLRNDPFCRK